MTITVGLSGRQLLESPLLNLPALDKCKYVANPGTHYECEASTNAEYCNNCSSSCSNVLCGERAPGCPGDDSCAPINCDTWIMPEGYDGPCCTSPILIDVLGN